MGLDCQSHESFSILHNHYIGLFIFLYFFLFMEFSLYNLVSTPFIYFYCCACCCSYDNGIQYVFQVKKIKW